jgi:carboxyl-terminal processing protease
MKKRFLLLTLIAGILAGFTIGFEVTDNIYFKINKSIDIFGRVYKEIVANYVDEVDPEKFMHAGIDGMLDMLDPYTVFMDQNENDEIDLITSGQYGGVGISIGVRDGFVTVISPIEGYSAQKQGIRAGDRIIEIDSVKVTGMDLDSIRTMVRGTPGTEVKMKIQREGEARPLDFVLRREEIQVNDVSYAGLLDDGIGYIRLDRFSRNAGDEVRRAIADLRVKIKKNSTGDTELRGIILDLRNNPGGLLESAVDIVSNFLPKGSTVVTTRGRKGEDEHVYTVTDDPTLPTIPLAIVVNRNSASASEIVTGAIQDYDRGVVVGTRTFGKGLVQTITQLGYDATLKITTARYYTPSGRCIQEIDYAHKNKDGIFLTTPDSLKHKFKTKHGRIVLEAGGIAPDTVVKDEEPSALYKALLQKAMFFEFATTYVANHPGDSTDFIVTDSVLDEFNQYLKKKKFDYEDDVQHKLSDVEGLLKKEKYSSKLLADVNDINKQIEAEKANAFQRHKEEIREGLEEEIISRYQGERGRIRVSLAEDNQVKVAEHVLESKQLYSSTLKVAQP